jgi:hypothetical protein
MAIMPAVQTVRLELLDHPLHRYNAKDRFRTAVGVEGE